MSPAPCTLDHLILLVPSLSEETLAPFTSAGFELVLGGTHADGLTENVLVPLQDGICESPARVETSVNSEKS